jgi:hypothetical protein
VIADQHRRSLTTRNLRVQATFTVDGFAAGSWSVARRGRTATLTLAPFGRLPRAVADELVAAAEALLRFAEAGASERRVEIAKP